MGVAIEVLEESVDLSGIEGLRLVFGSYEGFHLDGGVAFD